MRLNREQRERCFHCHVEGKAVKVTKGARHFKTVIKLSPGCILRLPLCVGREGHRKATLLSGCNRFISFVRAVTLPAYDVLTHTVIIQLFLVY